MSSDDGGFQDSHSIPDRLTVVTTYEPWRDGQTQPTLRWQTKVTLEPSLNTFKGKAYGKLSRLWTACDLSIMGMKTSKRRSYPQLTLSSLQPVLQFSPSDKAVLSEDGQGVPMSTVISEVRNDIELQTATEIQKEIDKWKKEHGINCDISIRTDFTPVPTSLVTVADRTQEAGTVPALPSTDGTGVPTERTTKPNNESAMALSYESQLEKRPRAAKSKVKGKRRAPQIQGPGSEGKMEPRTEASATVASVDEALEHVGLAGDMVASSTGEPASEQVSASQVSVSQGSASQDSASQGSASQGSASQGSASQNLLSRSSASKASIVHAPSAIKGSRARPLTQLKVAFQLPEPRSEADDDSDTSVATDIGVGAEGSEGPPDTTSTEATEVQSPFTQAFREPQRRHYVPPRRKCG